MTFRTIIFELILIPVLLYSGLNDAAGPPAVLSFDPWQPAGSEERQAHPSGGQPQQDHDHTSLLEHPETLIKMLIG